jgi:putative peptide zinc metalloprotease protein
VLRALCSVPASGDGDGRLPSALARALDPALSRPHLRPDVEVARFTTRWGERYAVAHSPASDAYLRFEGDECDVIAGCDGTRTVGELVVAGLSKGAPLEADRVVDLVHLLRGRGFLVERPTDVYASMHERLLPNRKRTAAAAWRLLRKQTVPIPGADGFTRRVYTAGGRLLFTPVATVATAATIVMGLWAFVAVAREGRYSLVGHVTTRTALSLVGLGLIALFIHEMSHALAVRRAGRRVVSAGFQLYLGHPAFFIDSTDLTLAPPRARAINALAGPYAEAVGAGVAAIAAWRAPAGAAALLFRFAGLTYLNVLLNLIPFLELDGYWLVSDLLDVPRLRPRSFALLRYELPARLRGRRDRFTPAERGLAAFGVLGVLFTVAALVTAWTVWGPIARRLIDALWAGGAGGRGTLALLLILIIGPLTHVVWRAVLALVSRMRQALADLKFWSETSWRLKAAEAIASLPAMADLDDEVMADLAGRVTRRHVRTGEIVIREGTAADALFLVHAGHLAVSQRTPEGGERRLRELGPRDAFGELALLESRPRTATVTAETDGQLYVVDAGTFGRLLAPAMSGPLGEYKQSLAEVWSLPPFRHLGQAEAAVVAERGQWEILPPSATVVREGEVGDRFYIVGAGQAEVVCNGERVGILRAGDHFGEVALLAAVRRTATVRTLTPSRMFSLNAEDFGNFMAGAFAGSTTRVLANTHAISGAH